MVLLRGADAKRNRLLGVVVQGVVMPEPFECIFGRGVHVQAVVHQQVRRVPEHEAGQHSERGVAKHEVKEEEERSHKHGQDGWHGKAGFCFSGTRGARRA